MIPARLPCNTELKWVGELEEWGPNDASWFVKKIKIMITWPTSIPPFPRKVPHHPGNNVETSFFANKSVWSKNIPSHWSVFPETVRPRLFPCPSRAVLLPDIDPSKATAWNNGGDDHIFLCEKKNKMKPTNPNADTNVEKQRFNTCLSQFAANPLVEHPDLTDWGDTLVGHPCLTLLRYTLVRDSCLTLLLDTLVRHFLLDALTCHSCKTLL